MVVKILWLHHLEELLKILDNMNNPLHLKKIEILTRLIKDEAITMHEALILLKDEESSTNQDYVLDSDYWTADQTNPVIFFDGDISN
jgi:hypothetical protein